MKFIRILPIILASVLTAFTAYVALDTFVIPRAYSTVSEVPSSASSETETETSSESVSADPVITSTSYTDDDIQITLETYYVNDTYVYVADVVVSSSGYIKTALANDTYGRNITDTTSSIASDNSAILAINGDYYGSQEKGYVIRNGVLYRDKAESGQEDLVIYYDGSFEIISEDEISAQELIDAGAWQLLSFGPALLEGGEVSISQNEEVDRAMASNPRTALGIIEDGHYVFVVSDGRTSESEGLSLYELAEFMQTLGVETAYNLDGGGSSTMYFNGQVVNNPTTNGSRIKERSVSDIVYIG